MTTKSELKTILVTGCSAGGVGAALAIALATKGHYVFATARNLSKIPPALVSLPTVTTLLLDVTCKTSIATVATAVADATRARGNPGLDVLINNAGVGYTAPLLDTDLDLAQRVYDTNIWGPIRIIQSFADLLIKKKGRLVNMCSISSVLHMPWMGTSYTILQWKTTDSFLSFHYNRNIRLVKGSHDRYFRHSTS